MRLIVRLIAWLSKCLLLLFTLRRVIFIWGAGREQEAGSKEQGVGSKGEEGGVLIVVPVHNEEEGLGRFLEALKQMDWCGGEVVFVDDGSTDGSRGILEEWVRDRPKTQLIALNQNIGKAAALEHALSKLKKTHVSGFGNPETRSPNIGNDVQKATWVTDKANLSQHGFGISKSRNINSFGFLAVFDADDLPQPDALRKLLDAFTGERIAAVTGRRAVSNPLASHVATYCAYENLVHQHVTVAAKHKLDLNPPILGSNCVYRLSALEAVGGFQLGTLLEDSDLTVRFAKAGWQTRYVPNAIAFHDVPTTIQGYVSQHLRWSRGFHQTIKRQNVEISRYKKDKATRMDSSKPMDMGVPRRPVPTTRMIETWMFSMGYLDRVALLLSFILHPSSFILHLYLLLPFLQTLAALKRENAPRKMWVRLWVLPFFFCVDITLAVVSLAQSVLRRPTRWENARTV